LHSFAIVQSAASLSNHGKKEKNEQK